MEISDLIREENKETRDQPCPWATEGCRVEHLLNAPSHNNQVVAKEKKNIRVQNYVASELAGAAKNFTA